MKKFILLFVVLVSITVLPHQASASFLNDFARWIIPTELRPAPVVVTTTQGVGGILISADPVLMSGDTSRTFFLPTLTSRSFKIQNGGVVDLFLNKNKLLSYDAIPAISAGDVPASYALNVGAERIVTIFNQSTTTNVHLSKIDLGVVGTTSVSLQSSVFVNNASAKSAQVNNGNNAPTIASLSFKFTLNNATNNDVYISRLINPLTFVTLTPVADAAVTIKFIESSPKTISGDSQSSYVIPAGNSRTFEVTGIIDNSNGNAGVKTVAVSEVRYTGKNGVNPQSISSPILLRNLSTAVSLGGFVPVIPVTPTSTSTPVVGTTTVPVQTPIITPSVTPSPTVASTTKPTPSPSSTKTPTTTPIVTQSPTPSGTPTTTPSTTVTPSGTPTASPSGSGTPFVGMVISQATTTVGSAIIENEEIVGYPVIFSFTAKAEGKAIYFSKNPTTAFTSSTTGFGSIAPTVNNINAFPAIRTGDGGSYYLIPAGTTRSFQAFAVIKSDGLTKLSTLIYEITRANYGFRSSALSEANTKTTNLKVSVKLSPRTVTPTPTPSQSSSPTPTPSGTGSPSPTATSLIALCYAVPTNPYTGDLVTWQVMQTGGSGTPSYTWSGSENLAGSSGVVTKRYSNSGRKDALVSVVVGSQSVTTSCNVNVTLSPSPSYTPTPSETGSPSTTPSPSSSATPSSTGSATPTSTGSATPSGSGSAFAPNNKGYVANILYSAGEWLDSLFSR